MDGLATDIYKLLAIDDDAVRAAQAGAMGIACLKAGPLSCELYKYWLGKEGGTYELNQKQMGMIFGDAGWNTDLDDSLKSYATAAAEQCQGPVGAQCVIRLDSKWITHQFTSGDLYYAYRGLNYRVTGQLLGTITENGVHLSGTARVDVFKDYNFDLFETAEFKGIDIPLAPLSVAPSYGLARNFVIQGSQTIDVDVP
ncbi:hypothetical protein [Streptomyces sp. bgisy159]|uniref:hypothetical protein n=1 Tax=Streptomyces sp. bgisy159 TaxID=3413795 RepID=UPI003F49B817